MNENADLYLGQGDVPKAVEWLEKANSLPVDPETSRIQVAKVPHVLILIHSFLLLYRPLYQVG